MPAPGHVTINARRGRIELDYLGGCSRPKRCSPPSATYHGRTRTWYPARARLRFLRGAMGLDLPTESIVELEGRTEGWIMGLQLVALSMRGREDVSGFTQAQAALPRCDDGHSTRVPFHRERFVQS